MYIDFYINIFIKLLTTYYTNKFYGTHYMGTP